MNLKKGLGSLLVALSLLSVTSGFITPTQAVAASRTEIAQISVNKNGSDFRYWNVTSPALRKLREYVKNVTKKGSKHFIPVEDRIATFDMDGTLIGETTPTYFEWMLYFDRIYNDPSYVAPQAIRERAAIVRKAIEEDAVTDAIDRMETLDKITILAGLNKEAFAKVVQHTMEQKVPGLTNIKYGELIYLPMVEVISYLQKNNFTVYIVTGAYRQIAREFAKGVLPIGPERIIGADTVLKATHQGNTNPQGYIFNRATDEIVTTDQPQEFNLGVTKAVKIAREIGKKPVLSFGNSMGDSSMHEYTLSHKKYRTMAFSLLCDDLEREYGNLRKAEKMRKTCQKLGWVPVSMHDDWRTIYGENVKRNEE